MQPVMVAVFHGPFPVLVMKIPMTHAQGSLWLTETCTCRQDLVAESMWAVFTPCANMAWTWVLPCRVLQVQPPATAGPHSHKLLWFILRLIRNDKEDCSKVSLLFWSWAALSGRRAWYIIPYIMCCWGNFQSPYWLICFSHHSGRRISSCCKRSECTIAAEDHPGTAGSGKEVFRTWRRACGGNQSLNP